MPLRTNNVVEACCTGAETDNVKDIQCQVGSAPVMYVEARVICIEKGMRLCTAREVAHSVCCGLGEARVWTSTAQSSGETHCRSVETIEWWESETSVTGMKFTYRDLPERAASGELPQPPQMVGTKTMAPTNSAGLEPGETITQ